MIQLIEFSQENYESNRNIVIEDTNIKQTVYIYNCKDSTIIIKGKVNSVTLGKLVSERFQSCVSF